MCGQINLNSKDTNSDRRDRVKNESEKTRKRDGEEGSQNSEIRGGTSMSFHLKQERVDRANLFTVAVRRKDCLQLSTGAS